jgi:hypothetical protein
MADVCHWTLNLPCDLEEDCVHLPAVVTDPKPPAHETWRGIEGLGNLAVGPQRPLSRHRNLASVLCFL